MKLAIAILGEGLKEIGVWAFYYCTLLREIVIPPAVREIMCGAFEYCMGLMTVVLGKGLKEFGRMAFEECTLLHEIVIPPIARG